MLKAGSAFAFRYSLPFLLQSKEAETNKRQDEAGQFRRKHVVQGIEIRMPHKGVGGGLSGSRAPEGSEGSDDGSPSKGVWKKLARKRVPRSSSTLATKANLQNSRQAESPFHHLHTEGVADLHEAHVQIIHMARYNASLRKAERSFLESVPGKIQHAGKDTAPSSHTPVEKNEGTIDSLSVRV